MQSAGMAPRLARASCSSGFAASVANASAKYIAASSSGPVRISAMYCTPHRLASSTTSSTMATSGPMLVPPRAMAITHIRSVASSARVADAWPLAASGPERHRFARHPAHPAWVRAMRASALFMAVVRMACAAAHWMAAMFPPLATRLARATPAVRPTSDCISGPPCSAMACKHVAAAAAAPAVAWYLCATTSVMSWTSRPAAALRALPAAAARLASWRTPPARAAMRASSGSSSTRPRRISAACARLATGPACNGGR
eukprot:248450-Prorocentrum_minimum.AAC.4